jgi:hypothetical protein
MRQPPFPKNTLPSGQKNKKKIKQQKYIPIVTFFVIEATNIFPISKFQLVS